MNGFKKEIVNQIDDKIRLPYILYIPENMLNYLTTITKKRFKKNEIIRQQNAHHSKKAFIW